MKRILTALTIFLVGIIGFGLGNVSSNQQSEYDRLVKIADTQAVKIAIIEQSSKLETYTRQIQESQRRMEIARRELRDKVQAAQNIPKDVNDNN